MDASILFSQACFKTPYLLRGFANDYYIFTTYSEDPYDRWRFFRIFRDIISDHYFTLIFENVLARATIRLKQLQYVVSFQGRWVTL